jgi:hypothetical protein
MYGGQRFHLILFVVFLIPGVAFSRTSVFTGKWGVIENFPGSVSPYSVLDLSLIEGSGGELNGSYCFVTQYGGKIDCSPEEANISGHVVTGHANRAVVNFNSFFGAKNGVAELEVNDDGSITWNVITVPRGGEYYGPSHAIFRKEVSEARLQAGEKAVVVNRAYLYDEPSFENRGQAYLIKGDHVEIVKVSSDLKFWQIEYAPKRGGRIKKWLDCRDIDFCAK